PWRKAAYSCHRDRRPRHRRAIPPSDPRRRRDHALSAKQRDQASVASPPPHSSLSLWIHTWSCHRARIRRRVSNAPHRPGLWVQSAQPCPMLLRRHSGSGSVRSDWFLPHRRIADWVRADRKQSRTAGSDRLQRHWLSQASMAIPVANGSTVKPSGTLMAASAGLGTTLDRLAAVGVSSDLGRSAGVILRVTPGASECQSPYAALPVRTVEAS